MKKTQNIKINGLHQRPITLDIFSHEDADKSPLVLFIHGFKGFKDWGHFNLIADAFVKAGFSFVKFNFSHNGTTPDALEDFADLEAFGQNNFTMELDETKLVIDYLEQQASSSHYDFEKLYLIGHSRGGGIAVLTAFEDKRVKKLITWASVASFDNLFKSIDTDKWKNDGVVYSFNSRTKQDMPLYYQLYEDFRANADRLNIVQAASQLSITWLIIHGKSDTSVAVRSAEQLHACQPKSELFLKEDAEHTFGGKHPYSDEHLPHDTALLIQKSIAFLTASS